MLYKSYQQGAISDADYEIKIAAYSQQMDTLQEWQKERESTAMRYAEVKCWLAEMKRHLTSSEAMNVDDTLPI